MKYKRKRHAPPLSDDPLNKFLPLTQGQNTLVPVDLFEWLTNWNWCVQKRRERLYAGRARAESDGPGAAIVYLHTAIWQELYGPIPTTKTVDHANWNGLDNRPVNLRLATRHAQQWNQSRRANNVSGFIGVSHQREKWIARGRHNRQEKFLGCFDDPFSAAWVRDEFVKAIRGEFAVTNSLVDRRVKQLRFAVERRAKPHPYLAA
jgi:hypothetical protein